jgi:hypothetical protein
MREKALSAQHLVGVAHQDLEQAELAGCQLHPPPLHLDSSRTEVEGDPSGSQHRRLDHALVVVTQCPGLALPKR